MVEKGLRSPESNNQRQTDTTPEKIAAVVPHPELPIVTSYFSAKPNGEVVLDGGPGIGNGSMNGHIEDILKAISVVAMSDTGKRCGMGFSKRFGEGVMDIGVSVSTSSDFVRKTRRYLPVERLVYYVGPQETEEQAKRFQESGVNKVAIPFKDEEIEEFTGLLKPETKYRVVDPGGKALKRVVVEL